MFKILASSRMEAYIIKFYEELMAELHKIAKDRDESVTAWENDYMELKVSISKITSSHWYSFMGGLDVEGWDKSGKIDDKSITYSKKVKKSFLKIQPLFFRAWFYIHCPLAELEKDSGRKIPVKELLLTLQEWGHGDRELDFSKKNVFKKIDFKTAKANNDDDFRLLFIEKKWREINSKYFGNKLKRPTFRFLRRSVKNTHGRWSRNSLTLELHRGMFNLDEHHFDETLIHECCHQAVTEIDGETFQGADGGHHATWQKWMEHCGLDPERFASEEAHIQLHGKQKEFEEGIKGLKELDDAEVGDLIKTFAVEHGWIVMKLLKYTRNGLKGMSVTNYSVWTIRNIENRRFYPVSKKDIPNIKAVEEKFNQLKGKV